MDDYTLFKEEKGKFGTKWGSQDSLVSKEQERVYKSFEYKTSIELESFPFTSKYTTYSGGGYVYELRGKLKYLKGNLSLLQEMNWIDRQTRAVFIEFSLFNPNINLVSVCTFLVEFLPTGNLLKLYRFDQIDLLNIDFSTLNLFKIAAFLIYLLFLFYFLYKELIKFNKLKWDYFKEFWTWIIFMLAGCSISVIVLFVLRMKNGYDLMKFFKQTAGYKYKKFQFMNYINEAYICCMAVSSTLSTLFLFKLLRFNKRITLLSATLKHCGKSLLVFMILFLIVYSAFVQIFYLFFGENSFEFSTLLRSFETTFQILLGKFEVKSLTQKNPIFGSAIFCAYNLVVVLVLTSILITILTDGYEEVKDKAHEYRDDEEVWRLMKQKCKNFLGIKDKEPEERPSKPGHLGNLDMKADFIIKKVEKSMSSKSTKNKKQLKDDFLNFKLD